MSVRYRWTNLSILLAWMLTWPVLLFLVPCSAVGAIFLGAVLAENNETGTSADFAQLESQLERRIPDEIKRIQNLGPLYWTLNETYVIRHRWIACGHGVVVPATFMEQRLAELDTPNYRFPKVSSDRPRSLPDAPIRFGSSTFDGISLDRYVSVHIDDFDTQFHGDISIDTLTGVFTFTLQGGRERRPPVNPL